MPALAKALEKALEQTPGKRLSGVLRYQRIIQHNFLADYIDIRDSFLPGKRPLRNPVR
jgi:hypothetical protein